MVTCEKTLPVEVVDLCFESCWMWWHSLARRPRQCGHRFDAILDLLGYFGTEQRLAFQVRLHWWMDGWELLALSSWRIEDVLRPGEMLFRIRNNIELSTGCVWGSALPLRHCKELVRAKVHMLIYDELTLTYTCNRRPCGLNSSVLKSHRPTWQGAELETRDSRSFRCAAARR